MFKNKNYILQTCILLYFYSNDIIFQYKLYIFNSFFEIIQYILQLVLLDDDTCSKIVFDQPYDVTTPRELNRLSQQGFIDYADQNLRFAQSYLATAEIPDISMNIGGYTITLEDIQIADSQFPPVNVQFNQQIQSSYVSVQGINFTMVFLFTIQEQHYPYMSDKGNGTILLRDVQLVGDLGAHLSDTCVGALEVNMSSFDLMINTLNITMDSPNSYIYNGILSLLTEQLKDMFNTVLQEPLYDAFIQVANNGLNGASTTSHIWDDYNKTGCPAVNQRYTAITIYDQYFDSATQGLCCWQDGTDNYCSGIYTNQTYSQTPTSRTNDGVQYYWHSGTYQTQFNLIYEKSFDQTQNTSYPCDTVEYAKTGITFTCYTQINNQTISIQYLGGIQPGINNRRSSLDVITFPIVVTQVVKSSQEIDEEYFINSINKALDNTMISFTNGNYVSADECYYLQWNDEWAEFACNFNGSM